MTTLSELPPTTISMTTGKIPTGEVWVMGDNRCHSDDSRAYGPVPITDITGTATEIVSPANRAHRL
jgi:signal peptidase I